MMKQITAAALLALGLAAPTPLAAQDYPSKTIRMVVPFAPGGPADMLARAIAPGMSATLKQTVVIENKAGAGGAVGVDTVAKAAPDGYTIGLSGPGALVSVPFMTSVPYNVERDIVPIARVATVSGVIAAGPKTGFKTLADLIAHAKAQPARCTSARPDRARPRILRVSFSTWRRESSSCMCHIAAPRRRSPTCWADTCS
jgi:tripartite-type tricarboxylate transporter receptor subunit TctC